MVIAATAVVSVLAALVVVVAINLLLAAAGYHPLTSFAFFFSLWTIFGWLLWLTLTCAIYAFSIKKLGLAKRWRSLGTVFGYAVPPLLAWFVINVVFGLLVESTPWGKEAYMKLVKPFGLSRTSSLEPVDANLSGVHVRFPKAYASYNKSQEGGDQDMLLLEVLYPDFSPYSNENREEFFQTGWGSKVRITLSKAEAPEAASHRFHTLYSDNYQSVPSGGEFGLTRYLRVKEEDHGFGAELYVRGDRDRPSYYLVCGKSEGYPYPPNPGCETLVYMESALSPAMTHSAFVSVSAVMLTGM